MVPRFWETGLARAASYSCSLERRRQIGEGRRTSGDELGPTQRFAVREMNMMSISTNNNQKSDLFYCCVNMPAGIKAG